MAVSAAAKEILAENKKTLELQKHIWLLDQFAKNLRDIRRNTKQSEIAARVGISIKRLQQYEYRGDDSKKYEKTKIPPIETLTRLALALGVEVKDLVPSFFDLERHIAKTKDATNYESVQNYVCKLLDQFYKHRDNKAKEMLNYEDGQEYRDSFEHVTRTAINHYFDLESIDNGKGPDNNYKTRLIMDAMKKFWAKGSVDDGSFNIVLSTALEYYLMHIRPDEDWETRYNKVSALMEQIEKTCNNQDEITTEDGVMLSDLLNAAGIEEAELTEPFTANPLTDLWNTENSNE